MTKETRDAMMNQLCSGAHVVELSLTTILEPTDRGILIRFPDATESEATTYAQAARILSGHAERIAHVDADFRARTNAADKARRDGFDAVVVRL